jgi:SAM-dependent methyltransferase
MLFLQRSRAESFGELAALYDRSRPSYPDALIDALVTGGTPSVLDVGCGTGIAAALLAARGCAVQGVEIDERMAEVARAKGLVVDVAAFEDWNAAGRTFDLVTCAQAWHWIEPRLGAERAAQVLRPGGRLCAFWNLGDPPPQVTRLLAPIYARLAPGVDRYPALAAKRAARQEVAMAGIAESCAFAEPVTTVFNWSRRYDREGWLDYLRTHSDHHELAPAVLAVLLDAVGDAVDAVGGSFEMSYETVLVSARRADQP